MLLSLHHAVSLHRQLRHHLRPPWLQRCVPGPAAGLAGQAASQATRCRTHARSANAHATRPTQHATLSYCHSACLRRCQRPVSDGCPPVSRTPRQTPSSSRCLPHARQQALEPRARGHERVRGAAAAGGGATGEGGTAPAGRRRAGPRERALCRRGCSSRCCSCSSCGCGPRRQHHPCRQRQLRREAASTLQ